MNTSAVAPLLVTFKLPPAPVLTSRGLPRVPMPLDAAVRATVPAAPVLIVPPPSVILLVELTAMAFPPLLLVLRLAFMAVLPTELMEIVPLVL